MSRNWRHNANGLEDEKQREAHFRFRSFMCRISVSVADAFHHHVLPSAPEYSGALLFFLSPYFRPLSPPLRISPHGVPCGTIRRLQHVSALWCSPCSPFQRRASDCALGSLRRVAWAMLLVGRALGIAAVQRVRFAADKQTHPCAGSRFSPAACCGAPAPDRRCSAGCGPAWRAEDSPSSSRHE